MCFGGADSTLTVGTSTPLDQVDTTGKDKSKYNPLDQSALAPYMPQRPGQIDLTDETLMAARRSAKLRAAMGQGRASTFLTGPAGVAPAPTLGMSTVLGGG